jgi:hypothetical protein
MVRAPRRHGEEVGQSSQPAGDGPCGALQCRETRGQLEHVNRRPPALQSSASEKLVEEAELDPGSVRDEDAPCKGGDQLMSDVLECRRVLDVDRANAVDDDRLCGKLHRWLDRAVERICEADAPLIDRHGAEGEHVVVAEVEPGRFEVEGYQSSLTPAEPA